jgi:uncharacterized membrane protein
VEKGAAAVPTLVVIAYADETSAATAGEQAQRLVRHLEIEPDAIAVARRDGHGLLHLTTNHRPVAGDVSWGIFWMLVFALLFDPPSPDRANGTDAGVDDLLEMIARSGVDEPFRARVRDRLIPGTSALFLALGAARPDRIVEVLGQYGGELLQTTMTADQVAALREAVHGDGTTPVSAGRDRAPGTG